jgi:predicted ATPase with chaperone activity
MTTEQEPTPAAQAPDTPTAQQPQRAPMGPLTHIDRGPAAERPSSPFTALDETERLPEPDEEETDSFSQFMRRPGTTTGAPSEVEPEQLPTVMPPQPKTLLDVGLSKAFLTDLALKIVHYSGSPSLSQLIRRLGLGAGIVQQLISVLVEEHLVEVMSQSDLYTGNYRYRLSDRGAQRAAQALERSRYAGPAPVTAEQYLEAMRRLHAHKQEFSRSRIKNSLNELVLSAEVADAAARSLFSGKATLFFGPSGNGKTSILERYVNDIDGFSIIPYAIYAYGQTIRVFDQSIHEPLEDLEEAPDPAAQGKDVRVDRRWVLVRRPAIVLGAEMGPDGFDMAYDPQSRFYQAPPHVKAQGGVVVIDDFGRQKIPAPELLTRLLIPLERGWDTLTLATGEKLNAPLKIQLLFSSNIPIRKLADDSLLRRILYKVEVPRPQPEEFKEILRRLSLQKKVLVADGALDYVVQRLYSEPRIKPRASYGRDLLEMLIEGAAFDGREPVLDQPSFDGIFKMFVAQEADDQRDEDV